MKLLFENWRKYTQLNEEQLLIEGRIDVVKKKYPELTKALSAGVNRDSPLDTLINADPSGNQKYLIAMARILNDTIKKAIESPPWGDHLRPGSLLFASREARRIADYVEKFHELQPFIRDQDKPFKDINNIKNLNALKSVINTAQRKKQDIEQKKQKKGGEREKAQEESRVIYKQRVVGEPGEESIHPEDKTKNYIVRRPETTHASCYYGKGAEWCISADRSGTENYFDHYTSEGAAFYMITFFNLPRDHDYKTMAISVASSPGYGHDEVEPVIEIFNARNKSVSENELTNALMQNLLNLKKYPLAYDSTLPRSPELDKFKKTFSGYDPSEADADYEKAMSELEISKPKAWEFPQEGKANRYKILQDMAREQESEIMAMALEDAREEPAGPTEEHFQEIIKRHALRNIEIELEMPEETGIAHPVWESSMYLDLNEIVAHSRYRFKWKDEDEIKDIEARRKRGFDDYIEKAFRDIRVFPTSIDDLGETGGREYKITFERGHGTLDTFKEFMQQARYDDGQIESSFDEDLLELLEDVGIVGRDEREEHYWPDPEEKQKQLELPLQEVYKRWRQLIS